MNKVEELQDVQERMLHDELKERWQPYNLCQTEEHPHSIRTPGWSW